MGKKSGKKKGKNVPRRTKLVSKQFKVSPEERNIKKLSDGNFDNVVLNADKPVMVDFWASWCQPCKMIAPIVEQLAEEYKGKIIVGKLNTEHNQGIPTRYNIRSIPTIMFFKDGEIFDMVIGVRPKEYLKKIIEKALAPEKKGFFKKLFS